MGDAFHFLKEFLSRPKQIGALLPSSPALAQCMVDWIDWNSIESVVEFGPGTGAFTKALVQCAPETAKLLAVEINPSLAPVLRERFPRVIVCQDSVVNVQKLCLHAGISQVDAIICGLPWANFSHREQEAFLQATMDVLRPGGYFATFAYWQGLLLPAARHFRRTLGVWFSRVDRSPTVWRNVPPAFVYRCRR